MNSLKCAKFCRRWISLLAGLLLVLSSCGADPQVKIKRFGSVEPSGTVKVNQSIGIAVEVDNPDNLPLTYRWTASRGRVRVPSQIAPAGIYEAADTPGVETVTVEVLNGEQIVAQQTIQIEVAAAAIAAAPAPSPTDTRPPPPTNTPTRTPTQVPATDPPMPPDTPTSPLTAASPTDCAGPSSTRSPLPASETILPALYTDQPPSINGCLDDAIWAQAQPLTYAVHPPANDTTTMTVWLAWDEKYLYAAFDVNDTQVEESFAPDNIYDGDSVGVIIENGERIQEYRLTIRGAVDNKQELDVDRAGATNSQAMLKGATTLNQPDDEDEGYLAEMRIPWENPAPTAGSTIPADLWSLDHDYNPGQRYDDPHTVFSKLSWDGDLNVTTAGKGILLSMDLSRPDETASAAATEPAGQEPCSFAAPVREPITGSLVEAQVRITSREHCADDLPIDSLFPLSGTYTGDLTGKELWILVYVPHQLYFPQATDICANQSTPLANGQWTESIRLGGPGSPPETYHIVAVVAEIGGQASQAFHHYLTTGCELKSYEGLSLIPSGATELDSIIVRTTSPPPPDTIDLNPVDFERQASIEGGIVDEFILHTHKLAPSFSVNDGIDLRDYDLEFTFQGANERTVQLWYKSAPNWANVISAALPLTSNQPVHFNPSLDDLGQSDPEFDFAHIWAIGARVADGIEGVQIISARLIKR